MKHLLVALLVVVALGGMSVTSAGASVAVADSPNQNGIVLQMLDGFQDLIERIDRLLESVVDLLETIQQLFGGEAEGG